MQDIPRNELLNKLAAGWKVRRNNWAKDCYIANNGSSTSCHWFDLLKDDWEGEPPPEPKCTYSNHSIDLTFHKLNKIKKGFVRRKAWPLEMHISFGDKPVSLEVEDIVALDWEVWT